MRILSLLPHTFLVLFFVPLVVLVVVGRFALLTLILVTTTVVTIELVYRLEFFATDTDFLLHPTTVEQILQNIKVGFGDQPAYPARHL